MQETSFRINVIEQLHEIGWDNIPSISDNYTAITLTTYDNNFLLHKMKLQLHIMDLNLFVPEVTVDIPIDFSFQWNSRSRLVDIYKQFQSIIYAFSSYFKVSKFVLLFKTKFFL